MLVRTFARERGWEKYLRTFESYVPYRVDKVRVRSLENGKFSMIASRVGLQLRGAAEPESSTIHLGSDAGPETLLHELLHLAGADEMEAIAGSMILLRIAMGHIRPKAFNLLKVLRMSREEVERATGYTVEECYRILGVEPISIREPLGLLYTLGCSIPFNKHARELFSRIVSCQC